MKRKELKMKFFKKYKNIQIKTVASVIIGASLSSLGVQVFAQSNQNTSATKQPVAQQSATNPFGTVNPTQGAMDSQGSINYNAGAGNINGDKKVIIPMQARDGQVPNPVTAANSQGQIIATPTTPPTGLPQDETYVQQQQVPKVDDIQATIEVLNASKKKIRELNRDLYNQGKVLGETPITPPRSVNGMLSASLSPGATPPVIRLFKNRTTTIVLTDMSGQPWPISNYDGLPAEDFIVKRLDKPAPEGSIISITPRGASVSGNLSLVLKGINSAVVLDFVPAQKEMDAKTEIRVQAAGPNTQFKSVGLPQALDTALLSVLQGVAPDGSKPLSVSTNAAQAWLNKDGSMYIRTRYQLLSPAFENRTSSPDGTYAYKMVSVPVVLFKTEDGRFGNFQLSGF